MTKTIKQPKAKRQQLSEPLNYLHGAARDYHSMGLPITLCQGKAPYQNNWPTLSWTAKAIDAAYRLQPAANVGCILGVRSGLVDFDCDGADAEQTLLELFGGTIPDGPTWRSRRGLHRLFRWHRALAQLGRSKVTLGAGAGAVELLIGPGVQTLLPSSWSDGVQREWVCGEEMLPDQVPIIPDEVLRKLGCEPDGIETVTGLAASTESGAGLLSRTVDTDSNPTSVVSVLSVPTTHTHTSQPIMAVVERCLVCSSGTTNKQILSLAIGLKGLPELTETMGEDLLPAIREWYERSLPHMQEKDWQAVWERWLYLWIWAEPGHDIVRIAFEATQQEPLPPCASQYPIKPMQQLIGLCRMLQRQYANECGIWFLSCRSAGLQLGVGHKLAAKLLKRLVKDGILEIAEESTTHKSRRYRYYGD